MQRLTDRCRAGRCSSSFCSLVVAGSSVTTDSGSRPSPEIAESGFFPPDALPDGVTKSTARRISEAVQGLAPDEMW